MGPGTFSAVYDSPRLHIALTLLCDLGLAVRSVGVQVRLERKA